jgi:hypothetical protein
MSGCIVTIEATGCLNIMKLITWQCTPHLENLRKHFNTVTHTLKYLGTQIFKHPAYIYTQVAVMMLSSIVREDNADRLS